MYRSRPTYKRQEDKITYSLYVFDFRKSQLGHSQATHKQLSIAGSDVDIDHSYKYLGTIIDDKLTWSLYPSHVENDNSITY